MTHGNASKGTLKKVVGRAQSALWALPDAIIGKIRPFEPHDFLKAQPKSITSILPYETWVDLDRPVFVFTDGGVGAGWELEPIVHETIPLKELEDRVAKVTDAFSKLVDPGLSFQLIFDSSPDVDFNKPKYFYFPETGPQHILKERLTAIEKTAETPVHGMRLMQRRVFLTVRLLGESPLWEDERPFSSKIDRELTEASVRLQKLTQRLESAATQIEISLGSAGIRFQTMNAAMLLWLLRTAFHSLAEWKEAEPVRKLSVHRDLPLSHQALRSFVDMAPDGVGVGEDTWQVLSWASQPPVAYTGLLSPLLTFKEPLRVIVNFRTCTKTGDLDGLRTFLKNANDSHGELQFEETKKTQDRMVRGENLLSVSFHVLVRNEGLSLAATRQENPGRLVASALSTSLQGMPFVLERHAAPAIFYLTLPFCYTAASSHFSGREKRILSANIGAYLPLFGGFKGAGYGQQYMVSRAGNLVTLNSRDAETASHIAVLAGSRSGKSFFVANLQASFLAANPKGKVFIIDKKTSYEIVALLASDYTTVQVVKPPANYPNIFRGKLDPERLPILVSILKTAITSVTKDAKVGAIEEGLISEALTLTFEQNDLDARTEYKGKQLVERPREQVKLPRLTDIVANLFAVAARRGVPNAIADNLKTWFSPFLEGGPYGSLFDREEFDDFDPETPGVSLFDIDAVSTNPVLSTIVTQCILSEVIRQIKRPENLRGPDGKPTPFLLVIEEAGVLASESPELVAFIKDAWKTFGKLGVTCIGLTNEVSDYLEKPGPREIWNVSPQKLVLKLVRSDLEVLEARARAGAPSLLGSEFLCKLAGSCEKVNGKFSDCLWIDESRTGTFTYIPTGFDYWCAASKPVEVQAVKEVANAIGGKNPYFSAITALARKFPSGNGERAFTEEEIREFVRASKEAGQ